MPGAWRTIAVAVATSASRSRRGMGRICIVIWRATSDSQLLAALATSIAAPAASAARNVMMATTALSDRPAIESLGTIGVGPRRVPIAEAASRSGHDSVALSKDSLVDM